MRMCGIHIVVMLLGSGCSLMPYEDKFACQLTDNLGKCISVSQAYDEAVTGIESQPPMVKYSEQEQAKPKRYRTRRGQREDGPFDFPARRKPESVPVQPPVAGKTPAYDAYRTAVYERLTGLLEQPRTPMLAEPKTVRTMILPYASKLKKDRLWMPRYVYSIVEQPSFVLGNYLQEKEAFGPVISPLEGEK